MQNQPTIDMLSTLPIGQLVNLSADELALLADDIHGLEQKAKRAKEHLNMVVRAKWAEELTGHTLGTKRIKCDELDVVVNLPKSVAWDNDKLAEVEQTKDQNNAPMWSHMQVKRTVTEAVYDQLPDATKKLLDPARTVKAGAQTVKFERKAVA